MMHWVHVIMTTNITIAHDWIIQQFGNLHGIKTNQQCINACTAKHSNFK